jgi:hypothetical protein
MDRRQLDDFRVMKANQNRDRVVDLSFRVWGRWRRGVLLAFAVVGIVCGSCYAGIPLTDMVLYGRVYNRSDQAQVTGQLAGPIVVEIRGAAGTQFVASTSRLLAGSAEVPEFYVLRLRRFEAGTLRSAQDRFVMPGDVIRISYAGVEVAETEHTSILVTDALGDLRRLDLNRISDADSDNDRLPDDWERRFFGNLTAASGDSRGSDGLPLFTIFALGLDPHLDNRSRLPFLGLEEGGGLAYYYRQSVLATGLTFQVESGDELGEQALWGELGISPQVVGQEGDSLILKVLIPGGLDRPHRFLRLTIR